jgi:NDP-sugar pyrophosphorylase family protein
MEEHKVLITTSGLGSRLGNLTNKTNKCLVRITDKPSISHIIESYSPKTEFVITLGHHGDHVKQFLSLTYPNHNFTFVKIDKYQGKGSSLGYSILQCKDVIDKPFIFHASDTILTNTKLPPLNHNWVVGSSKDNSSQFRTINTKCNEVTSINDKGEIKYDSIYVGVSGIKDYKMFFNIIEKLVNHSNEELSDVHVISKMLTKTKFKHFFVPPNNWFDVGNVNELNRTRKSFKSSIKVLEKTDESIFIFDEFVVKFFANSKINKNRVLRGNSLYPLTPKIIGSTKNFYKYKKVEGNLFSNSVRASNFKKLLNWSQENLWVKPKNSTIQDKCKTFYLDKTFDRINNYLNGAQDAETIINGETIPSVYELMNQLDHEWLTDGIAVQFHGDFILDNIIETKNGFSLIDWRQDFGGDTLTGDIYYDLAKLNHNLTVNHEIVDKELLNKDKDNCYILTNSILNECKKIFKKFCQENNYDYKKIEILSSLIWINMSPLHEYPFNDFLFNFGKYNLYKNITNKI